MSHGEQQYCVYVTNGTSKDYAFVLLQRYDPQNLKNLAWLVRFLPTGTRTPIDWRTDMQVVLVYKQGETYRSIDQKNAKPGESFEAYKEDGIIKIREVRDESPAGVIKFTNNVPQTPLMMGFALDHRLIAMNEQVLQPEHISYKLQPQYFIGLSRNIQQGMKIDSTVFDATQVMEFIEGNTEANVNVTESMSGDLKIEIIYKP